MNHKSHDYVIQFQFPDVSRPQTLEKRYQGILSAVLIDFMKVGSVHRGNYPNKRSIYCIKINL